ncbi:hypothetical protein [Desulfovibrio sp.]|uniref:hypothetical protein n=1 Tax=Desulfovibrio sp. TaxID=885 RepID=UPI0035AF5E45
MTFYLMKLLRRYRRSNPWRQGGVCTTRTLLPHALLRQTANSQTCRTEARCLAGSGGMAGWGGSRLSGRVRPATFSVTGYAGVL